MVVQAPPRRRWLQGLAVLPLLPLMALGASCGFELRKTPPLPFSRIALIGFAGRSPMRLELQDRLAEVAQVVDTPAQAEVVLHALTERRDRGVVATTSAGQVRELQLRMRFGFRLATPGGRDLIAPTELLLTRDMSYNETAALPKAQEEGELFAAMQSDIVQQVLSRLSGADPRRDTRHSARPDAAASAASATPP